MNERPDFPPLYRPFAVTPELDPFERCVSVAADGAEAGTLLWSIGQEACECAIVLAPEQSLEASLPVVLVAMLALGDALGSLVPPLVAVTFGWPDRLEVNGGAVGGVRMASAPTETSNAAPDWLVIGFGVALRGPWGEGEGTDDIPRTTLAGEGCSEVDTIDLLEAFTRHFSGLDQPLAGGWGRTGPAGLDEPRDRSRQTDRDRGRRPAPTRHVRWPD